jgi:phosphatidylglycerol:prolipoprotein diacylglycerol transferase
MWYRTVEMIALGPFHIRVWGLLVGAGIAAGLLLTARLARRRGVDDESIWTLGVVVLVAGIVGSRLLWALQPAVIRDTLAHPVQAIAFWRPGLTLIGGLIAAILAGILYVRRARLSVRTVADLAAPGFGLGLAIGRLGCFLTGLHPGLPTGLPWGIYYLDAIRHPIPLYESLLGLVLLSLGLFLLNRRLPSGIAALAVTLTYLVGRSLLDLLRAPGVPGADPRLVGGATLTQSVALVMGPLALGVLAALLLRRRDPKGVTDPGTPVA